MNRPKIVLLGMMSIIPVGGPVWLAGHYLMGLRRLGFDVYYVEAHARTPSMFMDHADDDATAKAVNFIAGQMKRFDMDHSWAFQALHDDGRCYGMSAAQLRRLYRDAALIINLHGNTIPLEEHAQRGRLVYLGTDPVELELELHRGEQVAIDFLEPHVAFFTWGLNYGNPDCRLPWSERFPFVASPPPVIMDWWKNDDRPGPALTTIGNWRQAWREVTFEGEKYTWSKHHEFLKIIDLPQRTDQQLELALASYNDADRKLLEGRGWKVRPGFELSRDPDSYRAYIQASRGEFTVAKDQNVRLRSGWFSERSATYLAAGRPVITQDTGFGGFLPTGEGLFGFSGIHDAAEALTEIAAGYNRHSAAATALARDYLNYDVVLPDLLDHVGLRAPSRPARTRSVFPALDLPVSLLLTPLSRRPLQLDPTALNVVLGRTVPRVVRDVPADSAASIIVVTFNNYAVTRMALESLLMHTRALPYEIVVVDNASSDETREYLSVLASRNRNVRVTFNSENRGFASAVNQGLSLATGKVIVLLNNDVIVTPGWLEGLVAHLDDPRLGAVGPVTNRCGNEAEVPASYESYGELVEMAADRARAYAGQTTTLPMLVMFCVALRREVVDEVGLLDERFQMGMFEDDDYARRLQAAGYELACAEDVFVHHFGEASFSKLYANGERSVLFEQNRRHFEQKWGITWKPHGRRTSPAYDSAVARIRSAVDAMVPGDAVVAVVSKGDARLVDLGERRTWHLPSTAEGCYTGHHPADDSDAVDHLRRLEHHGVTHVVIPESSFWWLEHYRGLQTYLRSRYRAVPATDDLALIFERITGPVHDADATPVGRP